MRSAFSSCAVDMSGGGPSMSPGISLRYADGRVAGRCCSFLGHLLSALLSGFPLTLPLHLAIGRMGLTCLAVGALFAADIPDGYDFALGITVA